jgi:hypothetical protein
VHFTGIIDYLLELALNGSNTSKKPQQQLLSPQKPDIDEETSKEFHKTEQLASSLNELKGAGSSVYSYFNYSDFEIINIGGGSVIKVVSDEACALISAITEVIKVKIKILQ